MTESEVLVRLCNKTDTRINWETNNPILKCGEIGYDTDTKQIKIGDGINTWSNLDYIPLSSDLILSKEASGINIYTENGAQNVSPIDLKIYGNSIQNGTPTPDTPIEIQSVGDLVTNTSNPYYGKYDVPVTVRGKNLIPYPYKDSSGTTGGITITINNDGTIIVNGTASADRTFTVAQYTIQSGTYTLSGTKNGSLSTYYMGISGTSCRDVGNGSSVTFDTEKTILIYISIKSGTTLSNVVFKPQLELGSTATSYEPYKSETKHIYLDEPLRKVGNYADYVDWGNQVVVRNILKFTLNGDLQGGKTTNSTDEYSGWYISNYVFSNMGTKQQSYLLCNMLPFNAEINKNLYMSIGFGGNINLLFICLPTSMATTLSEVSTILNGAICYMPLATPTTEPIENINIETPNSDNLNIFVQSNIQPSNIYIKYYTKQYQDIANNITNIKNNVINEYELENTINNTLSNYQTKLTFDSTPTSSSTNPVTSGGIKSALDKKLNSADLMEAKLLWGGKNISGDISPISAAAGDQFRANRLALLDKQYFEIEYSNDAGETWTLYEITQEQINNLIINNYSYDFKIGGPNITKGSTNDMLRITITAPMNILYCQIKKILVRVSTNGAAGSYMKIEGAKIGTETEFATISNVASQINISGWSGWNELNGTITFGGSNGQTSNYRKLRLTFGCTGISANENYSSLLQVLGIRIFAPTYWSAPSNLAKSDHMYLINNDGTISYKNDVLIPSPYKLNGTAEKAISDENGNNIINTYLTKEEIIKAQSVFEENGIQPSCKNALNNIKVIDYKVYGNSVQDGTPTPDTPIEIQSVGDLVTDTSSPYYGKYDVPVTVCGKNLIPYPYPNTTKTTNGITFTDNGDGTITANGTVTSTVQYSQFEFKNKSDAFLLQGGTYTLSGVNGGSTTTFYIQLKNSDTDTTIAIATNGGVTFNLNEPCYARGSLIIKSGTTVNNIVFKPQLELGSVATSYEPYKGETKHIYLDEPLYNLDYVDYENGFFVNKIGVIDDFSNITFNYEPNSNYFQTTSISGFYADATLRTNSLCNYFKYGDARSSDCFWIDSSGRGLRIKTDKYDGTTVAEFNEWIKSIPIKLYYPLATPTTEPITAPDFDVPNSEVMNVSSSTIIQPSNIYIKYYNKYYKDTINELNNKQDTLGIQSSLPVASSTNRGKIIIIENEEEGDTLYVCLKGINNTYYWQALPKANDTISIE